MEPVGVFYGVQGTYSNVTEKVNGDLFDYNAQLGDPIPGYGKHLVFMREGYTVRVNENTPLTFRQDPDPVQKVSMVYFVNLHLNREHQHQLVERQLQTIASSKVLPKYDATCYIEFCCPESDAEAQIQRLFKVSHELGLKVVITHHPENNHEYFGIHRAWSLARKDPSPTHAVCYLQSKSITRFKGGPRHWDDNFDFNVVRSWKEVFWVFSHFPSVTKAGVSAASGGWIWQNFWWARASFVSGTPEPIITPDRYYYEAWLGSGAVSPPHTPLSGTFSLITHKIGFAREPAFCFDP